MLSPSDAPCLTNISTFPALPGAIELTANISPLSFASSLCPNLCAEPPAGDIIDASCVHVSYVDPSAPIPHVYMYTTPVSFECPGAETNKYFLAVLLVDASVGSAILCDQPKFKFSFSVEPSVGGVNVLSIPY